MTEEARCAPLWYVETTDDPKKANMIWGHVACAQYGCMEWRFNEKVAFRLVKPLGSSLEPMGCSLADPGGLVADEQTASRLADLRADGLVADVNPSLMNVAEEIAYIPVMINVVDLKPGEPLLVFRKAKLSIPKRAAPSDITIDGVLKKARGGKGKS